MHRMNAISGMTTAIALLASVQLLALPYSAPPVTALAALPGGAGVLVGSQAGVFALQTDMPPARLPTELEHVHDLAFSPDKAILAIAGGSPAQAGLVELWSYHDHTRLRTLEGHDDLVYAALWLDETRLVTAGADRTVRVWNIATGEPVTVLKGHSGPVLCLARSPDGRLICSGSADETIRLWDTASWEPVRVLTNHMGPVHAMTFVQISAPQSAHYLASGGGDNTVRIWRPETGRMVRFIKHPSAVLSLACDPRQRLYSGAKDGHLRTLDVESGKVLRDERFSSAWINELVIASGNHIHLGDSQGKMSEIHL
jgi:WD40 repeat protein